MVKKEYVIPLIRKVVWRGVDDGGKREGGEKGREGGGSGVNSSEKSEAELSLDREAAEAIMTGTILQRVKICLVKGGSGNTYEIQQH